MDTDPRSADAGGLQTNTSQIQLPHSDQPKSQLIYGLHDIPPFYLCALLGLQVNQKSLIF